ncbi:MAG: hypothetical protein AB1698_20920 [Pseudomonadota bacterium]
MVRRPDRSTLDLFADWTPPHVAVAPAAEDVRGPMDLVIARLIKRALEGHERANVAEAMSAVLGRAVAATTLDAWASPAKTSNRIPLDAFAALIEVTQDMSLLGWLPEQHGFVVVPAKYADLIEMHLLDERQEELARRKALVAARYKGGRP